MLARVLYILFVAICFVFFLAACTEHRPTCEDVNGTPQAKDSVYDKDKGQCEVRK